MDTIHEVRCFQCGDFFKAKKWQMRSMSLSAIRAFRSNIDGIMPRNVDILEQLDSLLFYLYCIDCSKKYGRVCSKFLWVRAEFAKLVNRARTGQREVRMSSHHWEMGEDPDDLAIRQLPPLPPIESLPSPQIEGCFIYGLQFGASWYPWAWAAAAVSNLSLFWSESCL